MLPDLFQKGQLLRLEPIYPKYRARMPSHWVIFMGWSVHPQALLPDGQMAHWARQSLTKPLNTNHWETGIPEVLHQIHLIIDGVIGEYNVNSVPSKPMWGDRLYDPQSLSLIVPQWTEQWGTGLMLVADTHSVDTVD